jgi:hypothetical protein
MSEIADFEVDILRVPKMPAIALREHRIRSIFWEDFDPLKPRIFGAFSGVEVAEWRRNFEQIARRAATLACSVALSDAEVRPRCRDLKPPWSEESELLPFHRAMKSQWFFMSY